jgi:hypothetical protein
MLRAAVGLGGTCQLDDRHAARMRDKLRAMRCFLVLAIAACTETHGAGHVAAPAVAEFSATQWIPAKPSYVVAARTVRAGQRAFRDMLDSFGIVRDINSAIASQLLSAVLAVDPLNPDPVAGIGVDLGGGFVMFSEELNPTLVVHLSAPKQMQAFLEEQRAHGVVTQSVAIDGAEVSTAKLGGGVSISWAIDKEWLWVHFAFPFGHDDGATWFTHSHHPADSHWAAHWDFAQRNRDRMHASDVVGFFDPGALLAGLAARVPNAIACAKLIEPIGHVALAIEGDLHHAGARLAIDIGSSAPRLGANILSPPPGWAAASENAPLAAQMNLDLQAFATWIKPCGDFVGVDTGQIGTLPVRAARALVLTFDPDDKSVSTGAISADVFSARVLDKYLDEVPFRSHLESDRKFGRYAGKSLSLPFGPTVDYVLTDQIAIAAFGRGLLDKVVSGAAAPSATLFAIDVMPAGLTAKAWEWLIDSAGLSHPRFIAERLQQWHDVHLRLMLEDDALVLEATANRR